MRRAGGKVRVSVTRNDKGKGGGLKEVQKQDGVIYEWPLA